jgi:hypothetical protein
MREPVQRLDVLPPAYRILPVTGVAGDRRGELSHCGRPTPAARAKSLISS